ncbi:GNAT family N-acetyltransferase [Candidatus Pelagibacter sp.]|nr:GNAT family N-acetyltransferase [Candidatus Pelagibacter sp.]
MIRLFLKDKRIILRNFTHKDINKEYQKWFNGKNENLKFSRHYKKRYKRSELIDNLNNIVNSVNLFLGIFDIKTKKIIGTITLYVDKEANSGNIGIFIGNEKYFSKGFAVESCRLVINYLIKRKIVRSIVAGTKNENLKMINLMKNLKMKKIRRKNSQNINYIINRII